MLGVEAPHGTEHEKNCETGHEEKQHINTQQYGELLRK
jgi:hypothetical protein